MTTEQKLQNSIYNVSRKISRETSVHLNLEIQEEALDLIAEVAWKKLLLYAQDLEAFQKHAKRSTITIDDVKLLVRRNESLKEMFEDKNKTSAVDLTEDGPQKKRKKT